MFLCAGMTVSSSAAFFYPRLLPLLDIESEEKPIPVALRCSMERLKPEGVYLLENGVNLFLWLGARLSPQWIQSVFNVQSAAQIDIDQVIFFLPLSQ